MDRSVTIEEALRQMVESKDFKEAQKLDSGLRVYAGRIRKGTFTGGAAVKMLEAFGFKVIAIVPPGKTA
jgi:hypothetical protein